MLASRSAVAEWYAIDGAGPRSYGWAHRFERPGQRVRVAAHPKQSEWWLAADSAKSLKRAVELLSKANDALARKLRLPGSVSELNGTRGVSVSRSGDHQTSTVRVSCWLALPPAHRPPDHPRTGPPPATKSSARGRAEGADAVSQPGSVLPPKRASGQEIRWTPISALKTYSSPHHGC